eukprot:CAMPEP_0170149546 /NCGR_PEP_ID=MMETSP0033_2-20121228/43247_1 /TAXON_ID=195969 /ORGANISM="Dolichomastix tenuilepis, Strain CCMP3274" /LENGTH=49 /DNA_ID= /DNA_START= /DNA_END= /DNA_ORIENTATION=
MTEEGGVESELPGVRILRTGRGEFSDRLARALASLSSFTHVFYVQDDFW